MQSYLLNKYFHLCHLVSNMSCFCSIILIFMLFINNKKPHQQTIDKCRVILNYNCPSIWWCTTCVIDWVFNLQIIVFIVIFLSRFFSRHIPRCNSLCKIFLADRRVSSAVKAKRDDDFEIVNLNSLSHHHSITHACICRLVNASRMRA